MVAQEDDSRMPSAERLFSGGFNARVEGLFDVTFDDGRTPLQPIPAFGEEDCRVLAETLGLERARLPVNWSGMEPVQGEFNTAYFDSMLATIRGCWAHGVYTLVDIHQMPTPRKLARTELPCGPLCRSLWSSSKVPSRRKNWPRGD